MLVAERVRVREIDDDEGQRLLRIVRRGSGSVVTWRRKHKVFGYLTPAETRQRHQQALAA